MNALPPPPSSTPITFQDILYVIFRHKWKIILCTALGLGTATVIYFFFPPPFQSEAMIYVRYVKDDATPSMPDVNDKTVATDFRGETIMQTEMEILRSLDLSEQVADAVGPDKLLPKVTDPKLRTREAAAETIGSNLDIVPLPNSAVIHLTYRNSDPTLVQPVLTALVDAYRKKHVEVHRGDGVIGDFLSQETDQLRSRLQQTEDELRKAKMKAGIVTLDTAHASNARAVDEVSQQIVAAEALLAEKSAMLDSLAKRLPPGSVPSATAAGAAASTQAAPARDVVVEYGSILRRMETLEKSLEELLNEFTDESPRVKDVRGQLADLDKQRQALLAKYPALAAPTTTPTLSHVNGAEDKSDSTIDLMALTTDMAGLRSKIKFLRSELDQYHQAEANVDQLEGTILDLQRQKELDETNYKYYSTHLESTRIDEALGAGRALNLAEIQQPTPPGIDFSKARKTLMEIAVGGLALGLGWAFLIEYYFDRSLRRPQDIEKALSAPLFLSIPDFGVNGHNRNVFHETLRDRLIAFFESKGMTHKPKLLAVTGVDKASGVTSTASGLAQSLSQTGEGNVLLVDMTQSQGSVQQFCQGKEVCDLDKLLDTRNNAQVQEKLYVVGAEPSSDKLSRALPSRFNRLVPQLKASDFDYIIFDMPAVNQISITPRLAQFMDMVLLVVESEKTDRDLAKQATTMLAQGQTNLGIILNRTRNYVPSRAQHEFLGSG